jgi:pyruvate dehydrogenase (quinone)
MLASLSGNLATMGPAVPYAISAKFAYPDRPVIAFVGDGAFEMNGMNELLTVERYWERWSNPTLVFCVFVNQDLNQVTWEQRALAGDPRFDGSQEIPYVPAARLAELFGLEGIQCDEDELVGGAWDRALAARRPCVLEVKVDRQVPPMPPHITYMQAKKFTRAFLKGDEETFGILQRGARQKFQEFKESILSKRR